ncbi:hypothetical protein EVAR_69567_1 [Eumeta japonica]|uniref:RNase H type-1 domain-containing protein n=1 Tax=Eumeta variegata TaxID=151549 RepID=A0A4C1ZHQ2_EUMVA|nr:hypothetical protein EVAR_69567_1 [Eumeta japonica]
MLGSPRNLPAFRADPIEAAPRILAICLSARMCPRSDTPLDSQTLDCLAVVGPYIYTDGSRIEDKVGAALTEWRSGEETWYLTIRLDLFCTVFQVEIVALQSVIWKVKKGKGGLVNVLSDSRSALEVLTSPKTYHLVAHEAMHISKIVVEGWAMRLF